MPKATHDDTRHPDAALLAAAEEFNATSEQIEYLNANPPGTPFGDPRTDEYEAKITDLDRVRCRAVEALAALPAETPEGLRAKAVVARAALEDSAGSYNHGPDEALAAAVLDDIAKWPAPGLPGTAPTPTKGKPKPTKPLLGIAIAAAMLLLAPAIARAQHTPCTDSRSGLRLECALPYGETDPTPPADYSVDPHRWSAPHGRHQQEREPDEPRHQWRTWTCPGFVEW